MGTPRRARRQALLLLILLSLALAPAVVSSQVAPAMPPLPPPSGAVVNVMTEAELQKAVRNLQSDTTIVLAPGTYRLTSTLWIDGQFDNVSIVGSTGNRDDVTLVGPGMARASYGLA